MEYQCPKCNGYAIEKKEGKYYCNDCNRTIDKKNIIKVINVNSNAKNGQYSCPNCGSSEILFNETIQTLECKYCGCLFKEKTEDDNKIKSLKGDIVGKGSVNIDKEFNNLIAVKCDGCGAEIVIDANDKPVARCQWCRSILTLNDVGQTGASPDKILPFKLTKEEAFSKMKEYEKNSIDIYYANEKFMEELTLDNVIGVYMPYLLVDVNAHIKLNGIGKHVDYIKGRKFGKYDVEIYDIERELDLYVDDLSLESNSERNDIDSEDRSNNIINAIMPFDTENALKYTGNYLIGYNSEKRDLNKNDLDKELIDKITSISKTIYNKGQYFYDRGIEWKKSKVDFVGTKWISIYLPIWLYSYQETKKNKKFLHYIAVNGRTGKVMGSAPFSTKMAKKSFRGSFRGDIIILVCMLVAFLYFPFFIFILHLLEQFDSFAESEFYIFVNNHIHLFTLVTLTFLCFLRIST